MPLPELYEEFRDVMRIHLKQILKLDQLTSKVPMHTVALLVMVGYEALGRYTRDEETTKGDTAWLFARWHKQLYGIEPNVGRVIFKAMRNGLAHVYGQYRVPVDGLDEVAFVLTWKSGRHAHFRGMRWVTVNGRRGLRAFPRGSEDTPRTVCVDVESLWTDLDQLFTMVDASFELGLEAEERFEALLTDNRQRFRARLPKRDPDEWRRFLLARRLEEDV